MVKRNQKAEPIDPATLFNPHHRRRVSLEEAHEISKSGAMIEWHPDHAFILGE